MFARRPVLLAGTLAAGVLATGCGTSQNHPKGTVHAGAVTLLPTSIDAKALFTPTSRSNRDAQALSTTTLNPSFGSDTPTATKLLRGAAEFDAVGSSGRSLYAHVFVFQTLAGAQSLAPTFLASNRLNGSASLPSGAPGEQQQASTQSYGGGDVSYRYAFREQNVLSYIELDGPRGKYSIADAVKIASAEDRRIRAALS